MSIDTTYTPKPLRTSIYEETPLPRPNTQREFVRLIRQKQRENLWNEHDATEKCHSVAQRTMKNSSEQRKKKTNQKKITYRAGDEKKITDNKKQIADNDKKIELNEQIIEILSVLHSTPMTNQRSQNNEELLKKVDTLYENSKNDKNYQKQSRKLFDIKMNLEFRIYGDGD